MRKGGERRARQRLVASRRKVSCRTSSARRRPARRRWPAPRRRPDRHRPSGVATTQLAERDLDPPEQRANPRSPGLSRAAWSATCASSCRPKAASASPRSSARQDALAICLDMRGRRQQPIGDLEGLTRSAQRQRRLRPRLPACALAGGLGRRIRGQLVRQHRLGPRRVSPSEMGGSQVAVIRRTHSRNRSPAPGACSRCRNARGSASRSRRRIPSTAFAATGPLPVLDLLGNGQRLDAPPAVPGHSCPANRTPLRTRRARTLRRHASRWRGRPEWPARPQARPCSPPTWPPRPSTGGTSR